MIRQPDAKQPSLYNQLMAVTIETSLLKHETYGHYDHRVSTLMIMTNQL